MLLKLILGVILSMALIVGLGSTYAQSEEIPSWVKNAAGWWANGDINDDEFFKIIEFLIEREIITVSNQADDSGLVDQLKNEIVELKGTAAADIRKAYDDGYRGGFNDKQTKTPNSAPTPSHEITTDWNGYDANKDGKVNKADTCYNLQVLYLRNLELLILGYEYKDDQVIRASDYKIYLNTVRNMEDHNCEVTRDYDNDWMNRFSSLAQRIGEIPELAKLFSVYTAPTPNHETATKKTGIDFNKDGKIDGADTCYHLQRLYLSDLELVILGYEYNDNDEIKASDYKIYLETLHRLADNNCEIIRHGDAEWIRLFNLIVERASAIPELRELLG